MNFSRFHKLLSRRSIEVFFWEVELESSFGLNSSQEGTDRNFLSWGLNLSAFSFSVLIYDPFRLDQSP